MLHRKPSWPLLLDLYLLSRRKTRFRYGSHDCCLFACDAIAEMTGIDIAEPFRDQYGSREEAYRAMQEYSGSASVQAVAERIASENGMPEVHPLKAQRGDVILLRRQRDFSLALIGLNGEIWAADQKGYRLAPMKLAVRAWHV